ncbi:MULTISPECIES: tripartite tricarboxylate transporter TctB family protein [Rhizobium/Agrobacterium group]|jgi:putative tricarboxylic transport membrane protein|uniref:tripartite tricarboxylate transporter TctB family protein n=1 Tax=Rhizobium/Agrobacterium group TaxID=227290 RepID=UPI000DD45410|nr:MULTISPECIES: tripartite tricarboxylate transporter TctB family protein [unclassified Rhizobium]
MLISGRLRVGEAVIGAFTLALGLFISVQTWMTPPIAAQSVVGPALFPALIAAGLMLVGLRLLYEAYIRRLIEDEVIQLDWKPCAVVAAAFAAQCLTLERLGWIVSGTLMFTVCAMSFGSRAHIRNILFGFALTTVTYLVFDYALDLDLPTGSVIEDLITPTS